MTPSTEKHAPGTPMRGGHLDGAWRARAELAQEAVMPPARVTVTCPAPLDTGGLGRHLREILDALGRLGRLSACVSSSDIVDTRRDWRSELRRVPVRAASALGPVSRASRIWALSAGFDMDAARSLPAGEHLIAFNGSALAQLRAARAGGWQSRSLMSANSHYRQVLARHASAYRQYPIERPWAGHQLARRNLAEYRLADRIYFASDYVRDSFLEQGFHESSLLRFPLTPHPRFQAGARAANPSSTFDILYIGSLSVHKGVPLLLDALARLQHTDIRLILVGGWGTRGMRRFIERARAEDPRITVAPGDPLPRLEGARLCVHPAYEDGFGYAPAEALACGVPVIVSEDTGMKELIDPGVTGMVLPTGDLGTLTETIDSAYRREILA